MRFAAFLGLPLLSLAYVRREIPHHIAKHIVDPTKVSHTPKHDLDSDYFASKLDKDSHNRKSAD